jgi:hypothetical protein
MGEDRGKKRGKYPKTPSSMYNGGGLVIGVMNKVGNDKNQTYQ